MTERFAGHLNLIDRFLGGQIQPMDLGGALQYMGLSPAECGVDATDYAWARSNNGLHLSQARS